MTAPSRREEPSRVWFAQALRGPACLLVVFAHFADLFPRSPEAAAAIGHFSPAKNLPNVPWDGLLVAIARANLSLGAVGISVFFLVSGFVIPFSLERSNARGFVVRRFFRIYPTVWACLLLIAAVLAIQARQLGTPVPFERDALVYNGLLVAPYVYRPWVEPVLWTLAIEEIFYAAVAVLAWAHLLASRVAILTVGLGLAVLCALAGEYVPGRYAPGTVRGQLAVVAFMGTFVIFIEIGLVAHQWYRGRWKAGESAVIAALLLALYVGALYLGPNVIQAKAYVYSSTLALAIFAVALVLRDRLPYSRGLDAISAISFPLYLLHDVVGFVIIRAAYGLWGNYYFGVAIALAAVVLLAILMHKFVELPTNRFGRRLSGRSRFEPRAAL